MSQTQIKIAELRVYSYNRWGLAFFAAMALLVSGVVGRYYAGPFDIVGWAGIVVAIGCGIIACGCRLAEGKHIKSLEKNQRGGKT